MQAGANGEGRCDMNAGTMTEGERRKAEAHALLEAWREVFVNRGRRALLLKLLSNGTATADDVRSAVELPAGVGPKCFGSVPGQLARAGIIEHAGFVTTARPTAHARPVSVWQLRDRVAALAWLDAHPDRPDPLPEPEDDAWLFDLSTNATVGAGTPTGH